MEKNKNRTDLLAAGRKKLQQFRKKKETKGKSGNKGSSSSNKSEHEGDADMETPHVDPPESSLRPLAQNTVFVDPLSPLKPVSVQEDVLEPVALMEEKDVPVDASVSEDVDNASVETAAVIGSFGGVSDEPVVVREEVSDSLASSSMVLKEDGDEEKGALIAERSSGGLSSRREWKDQEADGSGSDQCDVRAKGSHGSLQDGENLQVVYMKVEPEGDQNPVVSRHEEISSDSAGEYYDHVETETMEREGVTKLDYDSVLSANVKPEGTKVEADMSIPAESVDEAKVSTNTNFDEGTARVNIRSKEMNEMDGCMAYAEESAYIGLAISAEAVSWEDGNLYTNPERDTEETAYNKEGNEEGRLEVGHCSGLSVINHGMEGTSDKDGQDGIGEGRHEARNVSGLSVINLEIYGTPDKDGQENSEILPEKMGVDSVCEKATEVTPLSNAAGSKSSDNVQNVMERDSLFDESYKQHMSPKESFLVTNVQKPSLEVDVDLDGNQSSQCCTVTRSVDFNYLAEVIQGLDEEEIRCLLEVRSLKYTPEPEKRLGDALEFLRQKLFFTTVAKDFFQLQLSEQIELQMEIDQRGHQLLNRVSTLSAVLKDSQECNTGLHEELAQCRSDLQAMASGREELETKLIGSREELAQCRSDLQAMASGREELETELIGSKEELARCRSDLQALASGREELETELIGSREELARCRSDLQALASGREELETELIGSREELARCRSDLQALASGREELETELIGSREKLARCRSDLQALASGREGLETELIGSREELARCQSDLQALASGREGLEPELIGSREKLAQCRSDLHNMNIGREELEIQLADAREEIGRITATSSELQSQLGSSHQEVANLLAELDGFRGSIKALETENSNLHEKLTVVIDERRKLEEENTYLVHENERLATQLHEHQGHVTREQDKHADLGVDLKEASVQIEQLTHENTFLSSSLDVHKAKLKEIESQHFMFLSQSTDARYQLEVPNAPVVQLNGTPEQVGVGESVSDGKPLQPLEGENLIKSVGFSDFKACFVEAERTMEKLEKAIEGMHSYSVSLSRSGSKVAGAGVSKLIQAFELKVQHDDNGPVELPLDEVERSTEGHFGLAKEQTSNLKDILKKLELSVVSVNEDLNEEKSNRQHTSAALTELQILYEASKQQVDNLAGRILELIKEVSDHQSRTDEMHLQLNTMQQKSVEMEDLFINQLENLQKDAGYTLSMLEQEWNLTTAKVFEAVKNLDMCIGRVPNITYSSIQPDDLDVGSHISASVDVAIKVIEDLHEKFGSTYTGLMKMHGSYQSLNEQFSDLYVRNGQAVEILGMIYKELENFTAPSCENDQGSVINEDLLDHLHPGNFIYFLSRLSELLGERAQLKVTNAELEAELMNNKQELAGLKKEHIDSEFILKLVEDVKLTVKLNDMEIDSDKPAISHLESLIALLVQRYVETSEQVVSCKEELGVKVMEYSELQTKMNELSSFSSRREDEIHMLKNNLREMDNALESLRSDLHEKGTELEQSEQRVASVREKLSIAVAKGKGLIVQRDNLKQSLLDMSSELERCSHEVQLKDTRLREVEAKLKTYSEAGERIEALESELSYIRNSATALRESFILKDSVLQRIEEVLEELELPENFHSRDTIEKIEWLVRSVSGNSWPMTDWHQKGSDAGGSYSDPGFVSMDGWKEDNRPNSDPGLEEVKRKTEELQSKFYSLAEHNEMLEQSLMERNKLVQRWEEVLDKMDMPLQLQSMETEEKLEWLASALSVAHHDQNFLQKRIENVESRCESLTAELEQSRRRASDLELALQDATYEREFLSQSLENLSHDREQALEKVTQYELEKYNLQDEVANLQAELVKKLANDNHYLQVEEQIRRLQVLVSDALQDHTEEEITRGVSTTECLERLLLKLIERYMALSFEKSALRDMVKDSVAVESVLVPDEFAPKSKEHDHVILKEELEGALSKLAHEKAEREKVLKNYHSLVVDFEALSKQRDELQEKLNQEEMKLVSTREKLNVAVRKGKGLVQQRDSLKQTIDEMKTDVDRLKNELNLRESNLLQYQQKISDLSTYPEKVTTLDRDCSFLRSRLTEMECSLQDSGQALSSLMDAVNAIDIGGGFNTVDPFKKIELIGKLWYDLQAALASSEQEAKKSKKATELLLEELNEVHERADNLQEELAKVEAALTRVSKERDMAEAARDDALKHLQHVTSFHSGERKKELAEFIKFKAAINLLRKGCFTFSHLLADVFSLDLEVLSKVEDGMKSLLKQIDSTDTINLPLPVASLDEFSANSVNEVNFPASDTSLEMKIKENFEDYSIVDALAIVGRILNECTTEIDTLITEFNKHNASFGHQAKGVSEAMENVHKEIASRKELFESAKRDFTNFEFVIKEKDVEILMLRRMVSLLYRVCTTSILEIENQKAQLVQDGAYLHEKGKMDLRLPTFSDGQEFIDGEDSFKEESIKSIADALALAVKDSVHIQTEVVKNSQHELKATISNLQKQIQENDVQKNRIYSELVIQIKEAEANAKSYMVELQSANTLVEDLRKRVEGLENERNAFELKIKNLQDGEASSLQLQEHILSLNDLLSAKGQEIEDLMQALDEEELQMEGLRSKIEELEKCLQQKDLALKSLEASRGKAMARLSTTVSKFDELHLLSESLLSEIENLQLQLQDRDAEISFLRQEVTRCTNDVLAVSQGDTKRNMTETHEVLAWLDAMISLSGGSHVELEDKGHSRVEACKETLERRITSIVSELEALRIMVENRDTLLQVEKSRTEELSQKLNTLENFLREKETKIASLEGSRDLGETTSGISSEITEVEPLMNKRGVTPHVRNARKVNNDQVAISIDMDPGGSTLDEDDDKVHGFKSLTTSRVVPRFTRPVSDMIDGLWVSCERTLMRQPALRLGIILYWVMLHTLLATSMI